MMTFSPFTALTSKIFGGVAIALLLFGIVQSVRLSGVEAALERKTAALATSEARHSTTRGSVTLLEAEISKRNVEIMMRAAALDRAEAEYEADKKRLTRAARDTDRQIERLRAKVGTSRITVDQCPTPDLEKLL